jgi:hypothetical protein
MAVVILVLLATALLSAYVVVLRWDLQQARSRTNQHAVAGGKPSNAPLPQVQGAWGHRVRRCCSLTEFLPPLPDDRVAVGRAVERLSTATAACFRY